MNQTEQILKALKAGERLTPLYALQKYGCFRLGARIHELRQSGVSVNSHMVIMGNGKRVSEYWL